MGSPIDRTNKTALDTNLNNGITSDAPKVKSNNDTLYNYVDTLNQQDEDHASAAVLAHPDSSVTTAKIANSAVTTAKIADSNVTTAKLANGAVTAAKLATDATVNESVNNALINALKAETVTGAYNVKTGYGATGDGSTDDTTAIQNAIDAAEAAGGGDLFFPPGEYVVSQLRISIFGIRFLGSGFDSSILVNTHATNELLRVELAASVNTIGSFQMSDMQVRNAVVRGNGDYPLINCLYLVRSVFERVHFVSSPLGDNRNATKCDLMRITDPFEVSFDDCEWWGATGYGLDIVSSDMQADSLLFKNCMWKYCGIGCTLFRGSGSGGNNVKIIGGKYLGWQGSVYVSDSQDQYARTTITTTGTDVTSFDVADATNFLTGKMVVIGASIDFQIAYVTNVAGTTITLDRAVTVTNGDEIVHGKFGAVLGHVRQPSFESVQWEGLDVGLYSAGGRYIDVENFSLSNCSKGFFLNNQFRYAHIKNGIVDTDGTPKNSVTWQLVLLDGQSDKYNNTVLEDVTADGSGYQSGSQIRDLVVNSSGLDLFILIRSRVYGELYLSKARDSVTFIDSSWLAFDRGNTSGYTRMHWLENGTEKWKLEFTGASGDLIFKLASAASNSISLFGANGNIGLGAGSWNGTHPILGSYHLWVDSSGRLRIKSGSPSSDTDGTIVGTQT